MDLDALLKATDDTGTPLYSESTVRDFLALVAIVTGEARLDPVLVKFKAALDGVVPEGEGIITERIARYFERYPLPARLTMELQQMLRDDLAGEASGASSSASSSAAAKITGAKTEKRPLAGPVEGTLRGGVFARVAVTSTKR